MDDQSQTSPETAPAPETAPENASAPPTVKDAPGAYVPTTEKPDVIPPIPHAFPASSAPLPEGTEIKTKTASVQ